MKSAAVATTSTIGGHWFILGAALLWGTCGTAQAFSPAGFDPKVVGELRLVIGGTALMLMAIKNKELGQWSDWKVLPTLIAAFFIASFQICFFSAVAKTGVAVGTVVAVGSAPIIGGLLGRIFRGEYLSRRWYMATVLAISGCTLLSLSSGEVTVDPIGILLALGAGISYAGYSLMIKGMLTRIAPNGIMAVIVCLAALLLSPLLFDIDQEWLWQPSSILVLLHLGIITMAVGYAIFAMGLQTVNIATATTLALAEPLTAAVLGVVVLGEYLTTQAMFGIALIFSGLVVLVIKQRIPS